MKKTILQNQTYILVNGKAPLSFMLSSHHNKRIYNEKNNNL